MEHYGKYIPAHKRFMRWALTGMWNRVFADLLEDRGSRYFVIDSSTARAPPTRRQCRTKNHLSPRS